MVEVAMTTRVVVWGTGGVGARAIAAIARRHDLDLVGVWVHSESKVGVDAGLLAGIDPLGVFATNDAPSLLASGPDCICYTASGPALDAIAVPDYVRFLEAGINVVTVTSSALVYPPAYEAGALARLDAAARQGGASPVTTSS
jgi:hypothetical protein